MKKRLDVLLTEKGLTGSRSRARALIMEGAVFVEGSREDKPGSSFDENVEIELRTNPIPFVSRGGLKLQKALKEFDININGLVTMDVGASTGGFTDCMLKSGAKSVYSIDVGYGQLDYGLRCDERVTVMERTNIRKLPPKSLDPAPEFSSVDVSFISLKKVIPVMKTLMAPCGSIVALIKPQFEAGREAVGKNGVVRDKNTHIAVIRDIADFVNSIDYSICGLSFSPIRGPKGNIEFLLYIHDDTLKNDISEETVIQVVEEAHSGTGIVQ